MKALETMIPYCGNCSRKIKKEGLAKDEYYCDVFIGTPMKGVVTEDIDGTHCMELGVYLQAQKSSQDSFLFFCYFRTLN